jgi:hypothetical protein
MVGSDSGDLDRRTLAPSHSGSQRFDPKQHFVTISGGRRLHAVVRPASRSGGRPTEKLLYPRILPIKPW